MDSILLDKNIMIEFQKINDEKANREIDVVYQAYDLISNSDESAPRVLQYFLNLAITTSKEEYAKSKCKITEDELKKTIAEVADKVDSWLDKEISKGPREEDFYAELWNYINDDKVFKGKKRKVVALYWVYLDPRIPYFKLKPGITIGDDEFYELCDELSVELDKIRFAVFSAYEQRIEEASVLLDVIKKFKDKKRQALLLAYIIRTVELRTIERCATQEDREKDE